MSPETNAYQKFRHEESTTEVVYMAHRLNDFPRRQAKSRLAGSSRITQKMVILYVDVIDHDQVDGVS